jgi:predicted metal-dependent phosphoesterase TrpH
MTPEELVAEARAAHLDAVLVTEHNEVWRPEELCQLSAGGLLVLGGVEIACREGDCLVLARDLEGLPRGLSIEELAREVHWRNGVVFLAHPFRTTLDGSRRYLSSPLDGLEQESCNNFGRLERQAAQALAEESGLGLIAASDAHARDMVGCFYVELERPISDVAKLVAELQRGAYRCCRNDERFFAFLDARLPAFRARVNSEVLTGTRDLEGLKRACGVSSDIIRRVLAEQERKQAGGAPRPEREE